MDGRLNYLMLHTKYYVKDHFPPGRETQTEKEREINNSAIRRYVFVEGYYTAMLTLIFDNGFSSTCP